MTTTNMFLNFGGKWDSPLKLDIQDEINAIGEEPSPINTSENCCVM